jgi:hypothetical protein
MRSGSLGDDSLLPGDSCDDDLGAETIEAEHIVKRAKWFSEIQTLLLKVRVLLISKQKIDPLVLVGVPRQEDSQITKRMLLKEPVLVREDAVIYPAD